MEGSEEWSNENVILFSALFGCDFVPRLYRVKTKEIESLMKKWKDSNNNKPLGSLLRGFAKGQRWPGPPGSKKPGAPPDCDFPDRVKTCIGLMTHAPVTALVNGELKIIPMRPLRAGAVWKGVIGFDPHEKMPAELVANAYGLKVWVRMGTSLATISQLQDPNDSSSALPHGAILDFEHMPICLFPSPLLLLWLFYHGVPAPKTLSRNDLIETVRHAVEIGEPLDDSRLKSQEAATAKSYISFDTITLLSEVEWVTDGDRVLSRLRSSSTPSISHAYINTIFGERKNGTRLDIQTNTR
mmetsp:Transcript_11145/g.24128  ORF Transcript_11145/g.24128 Transcript_11145/m.24128 type:complete len:298 (-) Transcript_11145:159-1052(-)